LYAGEELIEAGGVWVFLEGRRRRRRRKMRVKRKRRAVELFSSIAEEDG